MANKQFSANLKFTETEFRLPSKTNLNETKAGAILPATIGECLTPILIQNENQLIETFGYPTDYNYKYWFDCSGFLKNGSALSVVRPLINGSENKGVSVNGTTITPKSKTDMYNSEVAQNTIEYNINIEDDSIEFYNRNVTKNNDLAISVISNIDAYNSPLFNDVKLVNGLSYYFKKDTNYMNSNSLNYDVAKVLDHSSTFASNTFAHIYKGNDFIIQGTSPDASANKNKIWIDSDITYRYSCTLTAGTPVINDVYKATDNSGNNVLLKATSVDGKFEEIKSNANFMYPSTATPTLSLSLVSGTGSATLTSHSFVKYSNVFLSVETTNGSWDWLDLDLFVSSSIFTNDAKYYVLQKTETPIGVGADVYYSLSLVTNKLPELTDKKDEDNEWHLIIDGNNYNIDIDGKFYNYDTTTSPYLSLYGSAIDRLYKKPLAYNMVYTKGADGVKLLTKIVPKYLSDSLYTVDGSIVTGKEVLSPTPNFSKNEVGVLVFKKEFNSHKFELVESFIGSYASNAKNSSGASNYIETVINKTSKYIYAKTNPNIDLTAVGENNTKDSSIVNCMILDTSDNEYDRVINKRLSEADSDNKLSAMDLRDASDEFSIRGNTYVNLLISYDNGLNSGYLDDMSEIAKESGTSLAIVTYDNGDVAGKKSNIVRTAMIDNLGNKRQDTTSGALTSFNDYTFVVPCSKLFYDKYNDKDRWMSMAGDIAGYMASNDSVNGSWYPVAGVIRGMVNNYKRLLWSPSAVDQNELSRNGLNSIINDKELGYAYIFDYITNTTDNKITAEANVRRLLLTLKDYLRSTLKGTFFSFNDAIERNAVLSKIGDTFELIKSKRGLYDYKLICDETNNTSDVINQNQFVVDVLIQPTRMVKYIKVNFLIFDSGINIQETEI